MKHRSCLCIFGFYLLLSSGSLLADELTKEKEVDIRGLMVETGAANLGVQFGSAVFKNISGMIRKMNPSVPDVTMGKIEEKVVALFGEKANAPGGLQDMAVPIYHKYFTHAEIKDMLAFYRTKTGKKAISVMPAILSESMAEGQKWGAGLGPSIDEIIQKTLKEDGVDLKKK
jgi:hypothetical protein